MRPAIDAPRRCLRREQAAMYVGMDLKRFDVEMQGREISPVLHEDGVPIYDKRDLDQMRGWIYVVIMKGYCKIGWSRDPENRVHAIQDGAPDQIYWTDVFPGSQKEERALHRRFEAHRTRGEWFRIEGLLKFWIERGFPPDERRTPNVP